MERIEHVLKNRGSIKAVKKKLGIGKNQVYALRDKEGNVTTNMDKTVKVAEEFYRDLYSSRDNQVDNGKESSPEESDTPPVTTEEVKKALNAMQMSKAAGEDQVTADMLKDRGLVVKEKLATFHTRCLMSWSVTESWKHANIILIHKKGNVKDLKTYRRISLLSVVYKVFTKVIGNIIRTTLGFNQPNDQARFRKGYSTIYHIHNQMIEKCAEYNQPPLYIAFIDCEKAFDSVETSAVMQALRNQGEDEPYVEILEDIYRGFTATIVLHKETNRIPTKEGCQAGRYDLSNVTHRMFTGGIQNPGLGTVGDKS